MKYQMKLIGLGICLAAVSASAQTAVTTPGGTTSTIPLYTGSSTIGNSVITQLGGNVGIGTTSPTTPLDVIGEAWIIGQARIGQNTHGTAVVDAFNGDAYYGNNSPTNGIAIDPNGNLGIGTTSPSSLLDVEGGAAKIGTKVAQSPNPGLSVTSSDSHFINLYPSLGGGNYNGIVQIGDQAIIYTGGGMGTGAFVIAPWANAISGLRMDNNGNVGIGTTTPSTALEVNGAIKLTQGSGGAIYFADGTTQSTAFNGVVCGGDYAESVDVSGDRKHYQPGDVLVIDPDADGKFLKSNQPYSTTVAGIYSAKPGYVGRRQITPKSPDEVPMAMVGIVPTKVSAENGAIHRGDILVTSSKPGYAMKGTDRTRLIGAVVGKALGRLDSGTGIIEVLVSLQ